MFDQKEFRKDVGQYAAETRWTFFRFLPIAIVVIVVFSVLGFGLNSLGLFGRTVVERKVFENSYQRIEGLKSQIAINEAELSEIDMKLGNPNLDSDTRYNLEAHRTALKIRIEGAKKQLDKGVLK